MLQILMPSLNELVAYDYQSIKTAETESIINNSLKGLKTALQPELLQISGIPGSGKSTFCKKHAKPGYLFLSFDKIMTKLKGYQETLNTKGQEEAFRLYEMPARVIGYELLNRAIKSHINIMFEHSGTNNAHLEMFKNITKQGYKTSVNFIVCDENTAINRAKERAKRIHRYVPESLIKERATKFQHYIMEYQKNSQAVSFYDGANNFQPLKKI